VREEACGREARRQHRLRLGDEDGTPPAFACVAPSSTQRADVWWVGVRVEDTVRNQRKRERGEDAGEGCWRGWTGGTRVLLSVAFFLFFSATCL
jgi:hypothetical protein